MSYTKEQLGKELRKKINDQVSAEQIGKWAFEIYFNYGKDFDSELEEIFQNLFMMEEGPEFEYSKEELMKIANILMSRSSTSASLT